MRKRKILYVTLGVIIIAIALSLLTCRMEVTDEITKLLPRIKGVADSAGNVVNKINETEVEIKQDDVSVSWDIIEDSSGADRNYYYEDGSQLRDSSSSSGNIGQPSSPSQSSQEAVEEASPKEPKPHWVVDTPAWTEELTQPVYVPTWWIYFNDGTTKIYYSKSEWNYDIDNAENVGSWGNGEDMPDPSGATEVYGTIYHEEIGHFEYY